VERPTLAASLIAGAIAGAAATWLMDAATTAMQKLQPPEHAQRERAAWPNGQPSVMNLIDLVSGRLRVPLDERSRTAAANLMHYALGAIPGAVYAVLRDRVPALGAGRGLVFGALLWAVNDEYLNARLGLSGPPEAYPLMTHVRGLIGHLVLGVGTDLGSDILASVARPPRWAA
jgi:uncharacterized membrane protein YagU involved in acid resistance